jgi:hypothetical protein
MNGTLYRIYKAGSRNPTAIVMYLRAFAGAACLRRDSRPAVTRHLGVRRRIRASRGKVPSSASWWLSHSGGLDGSVSQGGHEPVLLDARAWFA